MNFNQENNLSPKDHEAAKNILSEAQKFTNQKEYFTVVTHILE